MPKRSTLRIVKRTVDALSVDRGDATFWERDLAGFGVRVHAPGRKVYVVQSRGSGGLKRAKLGRYGETIVEEARTRAAAVAIDRIKRGEEPFPAPAAPALTVAGLAARYMEKVVDRNVRGLLDGGDRGEPETAAGQRPSWLCEPRRTRSRCSESGLR